MTEDAYPLWAGPAFPADRLLAYFAATGIVWADRAAEERGDYKRVAFLPYCTLELEVRDPASPLLPAVRRDAERYQARRGEQLVITGAGQTVRLGGDA